MQLNVPSQSDGEPARSAVPRWTTGPRPDGRDTSLAERLDRLYTAVVSDCLDAVGLREQVMHPRVRPLFPGARVAGYAFTLELVEVDGAAKDASAAYAGELEAVDSLQPRDVLVGSNCRRSFWGELLSTAAARRGAAGVVADAFTRDTDRIAAAGFPVFVSGIQAQDSLGRLDVSATRGPIECGQVRVDHGDLVLADADGVVAVPLRVAERVIAAAEEKVAGENTVRDELARGMSASEAFAAYGIL